MTGSDQDAENLVGGFVNEVVRIGDTVRRPCGPWTPTVHGPLAHLAERGFAEAPRVLGVDDEGREVLTFLPGGLDRLARRAARRRRTGAVRHAPAPLPQRGA